MIFRLCFATSRQDARQIVQHGHIWINGKSVNLPSFLIKEGDIVELKGKESALKKVHDVVRREALIKVKQGLPSLAGLTQSLRGLKSH